jgi:hypothetical protein
MYGVATLYPATTQRTREHTLNEPRIQCKGSTFMIAIVWTAMCSCMLAQNTSITRESDRRVNATPGASVPWSLCLLRLPPPP